MKSVSGCVENIVDITGIIRDGMWNYGYPFPAFKLKPLEQPDWVEYTVVCDIFEGLHSQTGTYFETPGHFPSAGHIYNVDAIPLQQLIDMPAHVLHLPMHSFYAHEDKLENLEDNIKNLEDDLQNPEGDLQNPEGDLQNPEGDLQNPKGDLQNPVKAHRFSLPRSKGVRAAITVDAVRVALEGRKIAPGQAVLVDAGWDAHWNEPDFLDCPYFTYDAFMLLLDLKPRLLGSDLPRWENLDCPQNIFPLFYGQDIWMLAPVINLSKVATGGLLSVLPLNVANSCCVPCRAFVR